MSANNRGQKKSDFPQEIDQVSQIKNKHQCSTSITIFHHCKQLPWQTRLSPPEMLKMLSRV
jgi:hypothetical protein